jgi:hypothetical protein
MYTFFLKHVGKHFKLIEAIISWENETLNLGSSVIESLR